MNNRYEIAALHHVSLIVKDLQLALPFYTEILNLPVDPQRPELGYPGAWLKLPGNQQIHLMQLSNPEEGLERPEHGGRDRHVAFMVTDIASLVAQLERHRIAYTLSRSGRKALFCRDMDGNALEFIQQ